ncbi:MAG: serine/threonine protein kinase [Planctomycetes bacterium]|nr:serine/threonine protein kinase [Planctomycetota bacterium]
MPNDESRPNRGHIPQAWQPSIARFEEMLEHGEAPDLSVCLKAFSGELEPLVAELVATHQSFHAIPGNDVSHALNDLIQANPQWRTLISQAIGELSTEQITRELPARDNSSLLPRKLGRYLLVESLGKGGFSEVYLGCVPNSAEFVVIKIPRKDISRGDLAKEALRQEKDALLQLRGLPGVTRFLDWHEDGNDTSALVSDFEQARPLDRVCESEECSSARIIAWMTGLCDILQAANKAGVHHCDIKPQNVLIAEGTDKPILIDFGLSQTLLRWSRESAAPAAPVGTLHYLAPELLDESVEAVPRLVDMFGMGALLYYLMTGSAPFRATDQASARKRVANCDIDFAMLDNTTYAEELKNVCRHAIAKSPRERYQSPQALLSAPRAVPLSKPSQAPALRKVSPKKTMALVFAGSLLVLGGIFVFTIQVERPLAFLCCVAAKHGSGRPRFS